MKHIWRRALSWNEYFYWFNFRILHISCRIRSIVPTLLLILRHWMSIVVQNSFYPSIYFSLYHPLGMIFYWMRKKIIQQQKIQINFSHISQYYMMNLYSKRSCIDKKPIFHCTRSLWVHPSHAIFLWFYYPMILIFDI